MINTSASMKSLLAINLVIFLIAAIIGLFIPSPAKEILLDLFPLTLALGAAWLAWQIVQAGKAERQTSRVWRLMFLAMSGWLLAEAIWLVYELQGLEPYPSLADVFYLLGDVFLVIFFVLQVNFIRVFIDGAKRWIAIGALALFVLVNVVFVYAPILSSAAETPLLEVLLPILYETVYLVMLIGATNLTLALWDGLLGKRWLVITAGIWLYAFANQIFFFAEWNGLYRPDAGINWISLVYDLLYIASYQLLVTGFYLRYRSPGKVNVEDILLSFKPSQQFSFWVLLSDSAGKTIFVDPRLVSHLADNDGRLVGEPVGAILNIPASAQTQIFNTLFTQKTCNTPAQVILNQEVYAVFAMLSDNAPDSDIYWIAVPWTTGRYLQFNDIPSPDTLLAQAMRGMPAPKSRLASRKTYVDSLIAFLELLTAQYGGTEVAQKFAPQFRLLEEQAQESISTGRPQSASTYQSTLRQLVDSLGTIIPGNDLNASLDQLHQSLGAEITEAAKDAGLLIDTAATS
ncbi:MAG: hypothetical protein WHV44_09760 [Anaerolineales bacterium]